MTKPAVGGGDVVKGTQASRVAPLRDLIFRTDRKKHPLYGTPYLKPIFYFYLDVVFTAFFAAVTWTFLYGQAFILYKWIIIVHIVLIALSDYGLDEQTRPFFNVAVVPLPVMHVYDLFLVACDVLSPFLLEDGFDNVPFWLFPIVLGLPVWYMVSFFLDPNPNATAKNK